MGFLGAALLGLSGGYKQGEIDKEDRQYELARRAYLLKSSDTSTQIGDINLQEKRNELADQTFTAQLLAQPLPDQGQPQQGAQQAAPQPQQQPPPQAPQQMTIPGAGAGPNTGAVGTAGNWGDINSRVRAQQPTNDQTAQLTQNLDYKKAQLKDLIARASSATTPQQRQGYTDAIESLTKEIQLASANNTVAAQDTQDQKPVQAIESVQAVTTPTPQQYQGASSYLTKTADRYDQLATQALNSVGIDAGTRARVAMQFQAKAQDFRKKGLDYEKERVDAMSKHNEALGAAFAGLDEKSTQAQYDDVKRLSPEMYAEAQQRLGLTGDVVADRDHLAGLRRVGMTANQVQGKEIQALNNQVNFMKASTAQQKEIRLAGKGTFDGTQAIVAPPTGAVQATDNLIDENGMPVNGQDFLKTLAPSVRGQVKAIGDNAAKLETIPTRNGARGEMLALVRQYNPSYDQAEFGTKQNAERDFTSGVEARSVRSFNVGLNHLATLETYGKALQNGSQQQINAAMNNVKAWFGDAVPTSFDAIKGIVGDEVVKAIVGSRNALADREEIKSQVDRKLSPLQLTGALDAYKELFSGQLKGLAIQYETGTKKKDFYARFTPELNPDGTWKNNAVAPTSARKDTAPSTAGWTIKTTP